MQTTQDSREFSAFKITTSSEVILFLRFKATAKSAASIGEGAPYLYCCAISFELGEPAQLRWLGGKAFIGGLVLDVVELNPLEFEPPSIPRMYSA
ncbi:hypothetical protein QN345_10135 [Cryobacterium sp. 10I1]|uniref:hypothetical protein n=1 Tax=unclassified Cryobacterium TaxID=2649013 RepID=UPI002AB48BD8|nr:MULTISPECIES: hypothetical protein [unclassified Cryobacterium]MDY7540840.1 hypothetical protein [Cryobacterium sp. 5B3]MEA9999805.1 hypothetical protein [Cryobacterium sp. RTS3]MEB0002480.1 hypothetical protein [Cryobacterium sp. RTC2.1]MEB0203759.1 hypothetical protein [Cryobacterium sp. 5I3]MEB0267447.1 hypothetical protein [Cryobacterium sp. 10I5]